MRKLKLLIKLGSLLMQGKKVKDEQIGESYTEVSPYYEDYFLKEMHRYNHHLLDKVIKAAPKHVERVLDLACGTGYNSAYLQQTYRKAEFNLVDISEGMLAQAKQKVLYRTNYIQESMLNFLHEQEDESFDVVICCWAIKYENPEQIIKEVYRVLKPEGVFGVIVNTKDTLPEIRKVYPKLLIEKYEDIQRVMLELPNPSNKKTFDRWFIKEGFKIQDGKTGKHEFKFDTCKDLAHWITHTGALAGFDEMINLRNDKTQEKMIELLDKEGIKQATHAFVWGAFKK